jgi:hypothetical protein
MRKRNWLCQLFGCLSRWRSSPSPITVLGRIEDGPSKLIYRRRHALHIIWIISEGRWAKPRFVLFILLTNDNKTDTLLPLRFFFLNLLDQFYSFHAHRWYRRVVSADGSAIIIDAKRREVGGEATGIMRFVDSEFGSRCARFWCESDFRFRFRGCSWCAGRGLRCLAFGSFYSVWMKVDVLSGTGVVQV